MTSNPNNHVSNADGAIGAAESPHKPDNSELSSETSVRDADWDFPTSAEGAMGESAVSASAPDPSPLLDAQAGGARTAAPGQFWNEGGQISGATSNSRPIPPEQPDEGQR